MIYLKSKFGGNLTTLKDSDTKDAKNLIESGLWYRVNSRKDLTPFTNPKKDKSKPKPKKKLDKDK